MTASYDGVDRPDHVTIARVVHGPALRAFLASGAAHDIGHRIGSFSKAASSWPPAAIR